MSNTGNVAAKGTRIDFYWANPSAQMVVGAATAIGSAFVDLDPGDTQEVLCLVPWVPVIVNGGHECLLAVAHGGGDTNPIPDPLPNGYPFDPPAHEQIAQLNLGVVEAGSLAAMAVFVTAIGRTEKLARLTVEVGHEVNERTLAQLGLRELQPSRKGKVIAALSREPDCTEHKDPKGVLTAPPTPTPARLKKAHCKCRTCRGICRANSGDNPAETERIAAVRRRSGRSFRLA